MRLPKLKLNRENISTIIIVLFFFLFFLNQIYDNTVSTLQFLLGLTGFLSLIKLDQKKITITNKKLILWLATSYFLLLLSTLYTGNIAIGGTITSLQYFGIAILLLKYKLNPIIVLTSFYIHITFFVFHITGASDPNTIFSASRNMVSVIMLIQVSLVYISYSEWNKKITYFYAIFPLIISIWAIGRSGIISSAILLLGLLLFTINKKNRKRNIILSLLIIFISALFIAPDTDLKLFDNIKSSYEVVYDRTQLKGFTDDARGNITYEYFSEMKSHVFSFFLGVPIEKSNNYIFASYNNNLHNSYLRAHATFGLLGVFLLSIGIVIAITRYLKLKNFLFVFIFCAILFRISTDTVAFIGILDPFIYFFILNGLSKKNYYK